MLGIWPKEKVKGEAAMGKGRQSNFELLRILSMAFIISFHYVLKGGFNFEGGGGYTNC